MIPNKNKVQAADGQEADKGRKAFIASQTALLNSIAKFTAPTASPQVKCTHDRSRMHGVPSKKPPELRRMKLCRHLMSYHGCWIKTPCDILDMMAKANWTSPVFSFVDPATFADVVKIRRLLEEASSLATKASHELVPAKLTDINSGSPKQQFLGPPQRVQNVRLSPDRRFRIREQACQKLCAAFRLNEMACSMMANQSNISLLDASREVLKRNPNDLDALYVQYFHQTVPADQLIDAQALQSLERILSDRPHDAGVLRTRASAKLDLHDYQGAINDYTAALSMSRIQSQPGSQNDRESAKVPLNSLESQILFLRAQIYLSVAYKFVWDALPPTPAQESEAENPSEGLYVVSDELPPLSEEQEERAEARKQVKTYAKRALEDFISFITPLQYCPNLPTKIIHNFNNRCNSSMYEDRSSRLYAPASLFKKAKMFSLADLFSAVQPPELPDPPWYDDPATAQSEETVTYHPLLLEALHSILLCHILAQTSVKELQRHAEMVLRLYCIVDGYPLFDLDASYAEVDWINVLRHMEDKMLFDDTWRDMSAPPGFILPGGDKRRRTIDVPHQKIPFTDAERAAERRAEDIFRRSHEERKKATRIFGPPKTSHGEAKIKKDFDLNAYAYSTAKDRKTGRTVTERATATALWVRKAPIVTGTSTKRKKRTKRGKKKGPVDAVGPVEAANAPAADAAVKAVEEGIKDTTVEATRGLQANGNAKGKGKNATISVKQVAEQTYGEDVSDSDGGGARL